MKLSSRPDAMVVGSGPYTMKFELQDLELIGALLFITRLGNGTYKMAAYNMINSIESLLGEDFLEEASANVTPVFSVVDDRGDIIEQHSHDDICIEV